MSEEDKAAKCLMEIVDYLESRKIKITTEDSKNIRQIVRYHFPHVVQTPPADLEAARKLTH